MENQSQESFNITGESIDLCIEDTQGAGETWSFEFIH